jgi:hypothetical protein
MPECAILVKRGANWTKEELGSSRGITVKMSRVCDFCPNQLKEKEKRRFSSKSQGFKPMISFSKVIERDLVTAAWAL